MRPKTEMCPGLKMERQEDKYIIMHGYTNCPIAVARVYINVKYREFRSNQVM